MHLFIPRRPRLIAGALLAACAGTHVKESAPSAATTAAVTPHDLSLRLAAFAADSMMGREAGATAVRGPARNVIAVVPGADPALRGEYVAITAHNDHVGYTGRGPAGDIAGGGATYLEVVGLRRLSDEFGDWVEAANAKQPVPFVFDLRYDAAGHPDQYYCRADHYSYARYGIPSVSLSRGSHRDYHQLTDEPQYIDYPDLARLTQMVLDAAIAVAGEDHAPRLEGPRPADPHVPCRQ